MEGLGGGPEWVIAMDEIVLNGQAHKVAAGCTLRELLHELQLDPRWIVAELNGEPISREQFGDAALAPGDRLELVRPVAGG